jgi:SPP1 gp7 family putative phage head morphogenesis protein
MATRFAIRKAAREARRFFFAVRHAEKQYGVQLMRVSRAIIDLIRGFEDSERPTDLFKLAESLDDYADVLEPWAREVGRRMLVDVAKRDERAWAQLGEEMGRFLRREIESAPIGGTMQRLMNQQIEEVKGLPRSTAVRVRELANEALITGRRSSEIARELMATTGIEEARARMVARSAVATAATTLAQTRAEFVGSEGYIWRTSGDGDVRSDHAELEGRFIKWNDPPVVDKRTGYRSHAGCNANCRCYPEVVLPEEI